MLTIQMRGSGPLGVTSPPPPPVGLLDNFVDTNGTLLTAHTMNLGAGWSFGIGSFEIESNSAVAMSQADGEVCFADANAANCTLTCNCTGYVVAGQSSYCGVACRYTDSNNFWLVYCDIGDSLLVLYKVQGGVYTLAATGSANLNSGEAFGLKVVCSGNTITVYAGATAVITYTSASFNATATKFGLRLVYNSLSALLGQATWNNFQVTSP